MHVSQPEPKPGLFIMTVLRCRRQITFAGIVLISGLVGCRQETTPQQPPQLTTDISQQQLDDVLDFTFRERHLNLQQHAAWQILHGVLVYQQDFQVYDKQQPLPAIDHLLAGGAMRGWNLQPVAHGLDGERGLRATMDQGSKAGQGHADQWLAVLAQTELPPTQDIVVDGQTFTVADLVRQVQWDLPRNYEREYSWTLIGLTSYLPTSDQWTASDDQTWSIERLVRSETERDLFDSACGGTHRLIGITMALNRHLEQQGKLTGTWKTADEKIQQAIQLARKHQNPDGSFSTAYLASRRTSVDLSENLGTTGHVLEFLVLAMSDKQLDQPWVKRAVARLVKIFELTKTVDLECGKLYHAAHGLALYRDRLYGARRYRATP
ncbi:MAG: ADP-ribosylation factor-directed GTPase activating protein isoform b [Planctomycetaceae bacterium]|nr:ADP-ribosylation factor-directed GTPase activating protein isoform b [Planctomycetaceae bacterium]